MPTLTEGEAALGDLMLGLGTPYMLTDFQVNDLPSVLASDSARPQGHGIDLGDQDFYGARMVSGSITILKNVPGAAEGTLADLGANRDALLGAFAQTEAGQVKVLCFYDLDGVSRRVEGRVRRWAIADDTFQYGYLRLDFQFTGMDAAMLSDLEATATTGLPSGGAGRTYARTYPLTYGGGGTSGSAICTNEGNFPAEPTFTIYGPVDLPYIEHGGPETAPDFGARITLDLTIPVGSFLVVDVRSGTILLDGTASRYSALRTGSRFFRLHPGDNTVRYGAVTTAVGSTLTVAWRHAYI